MMNAETKRFHIGDILSAMTGRLVGPGHIGGVYEVLGWMVDEGLMTHQLPRVSRECEPNLREQFPDLAAIDVQAAAITCEAEMLTWLASLEAEYGTHREVARLPREDHTHINALAEVRLRRLDAPIIGVTLGDIP